MSCFDWLTTNTNSTFPTFSLLFLLLFYFATGYIEKDRLKPSKTIPNQGKIRHIMEQCSLRKQSDGKAYDLIICEVRTLRVRNLEDKPFLCSGTGKLPLRIAVNTGR